MSLVARERAAIVTVQSVARQVAVFVAFAGLGFALLTAAVLVR
jgi:hypothetical protein